MALYLLTMDIEKKNSYRLGKAKINQSLARFSKMSHRSGNYKDSAEKELYTEEE